MMILLRDTVTLEFIVDSRLALISFTHSGSSLNIGFRFTLNTLGKKLFLLNVEDLSHVAVDLLLVDEVDAMIDPDVGLTSILDGLINDIAEDAIDDENAVLEIKVVSLCLLEVEHLNNTLSETIHVSHNMFASAIWDSSGNEVRELPLA